MKYFKMEQKYNMKSPAVKRLMREAKELYEPTDEYCAQPVEDNLFEWHFTVRGPMDSDFEGGIYHGRIILPPEYPMKPPSIILLTPNGRFEVNKKICLSISGHHPESWQPSWSIRTALLAIIGFMPTQGLGAIGSLDYKTEERKALAQRSHDWKCTVCGPVRNLLANPGTAPRKINQEARDIAAQISFKGEVERSKDAPSVEAMSSSGRPDITEETSVNSQHERLNEAFSEIETNDTDASSRLQHRRIRSAITPSVQQTALQDYQVISRSNNQVLSVIAFILIMAIAALVFRRIIML